MQRKQKQESEGMRGRRYAPLSATFSSRLSCPNSFLLNSNTPFLLPKNSFFVHITFSKSTTVQYCLAAAFAFSCIRRQTIFTTFKNFESCWERTAPHWDYFGSGEQVLEAETKAITCSIEIFVGIAALSVTEPLNYSI